MTEHDDQPTTSIPTYAEVEQTRQAAQELAEQAVVEEPRRIQSIAAKAGEVAAKAVSRRQMLMVLLVAILVPLLVSIAALNTSLRVRDDVASVQVALERLDQANASLEARGPPPVALPPNSTPEQVSAAAITAQVVASLPAAPTADEVASRLQGAVIGQLQGPTFTELARLSADYFSTLPAPPGPTEAQIQAAVNRAYQADPPDPGRDGADGQMGEKGEPGESCLPTNPECVGPKGDPGIAGKDGVDGAPGVAGRSIVSGPTPVLIGTECFWRTEYDQAPLFEEHLAGDSACPVPPVVPPVVVTPPATG
jgi:hypothetical protein